MSGRHGPRSKNGCTTCLVRKVKCDQERPKCQRCSTSKVQCSWDREAAARFRQSRPRANTITTESSSNESNEVEILPLVPFTNGEFDFSSFDIEPYSQMWISSPSSSSSASDWDPFSIWPLKSPSSPSPSIPWSLSTSHIPCVNSVVLSPQDRCYLDYFPKSTTVHSFIKGYQWSLFSHIYNNKASDESMVMRAMMALSASELHRIDARVDSANTEDAGLQYYGLALRELNTTLQDTSASKYSLENIITSLFLLATYEAKFGSATSNLQVHLDGIRSFLAVHSRAIRKNSQRLGNQLTTQKDNFTSLCAQLLLWITYLDSSGMRGVTSFRLADFLYLGSNVALKPDRLFALARKTCRTVHGVSYPSEAVTDDLENFRALEFIHQGLSQRYKILKLAREVRDDPSDEESEEKIETLFEEILDVGDRYNDLMSDEVDRVFEGRRTQRTIREASCYHYSNILLHRRILAPHQASGDLQRDALLKIMDLSHRLHKQHPWHLINLIWSLMVAGLETDDPIHKDWIKERLTYLKISGEGPEWACRALDLNDSWITTTGDKGRAATKIDLLQLLEQIS